jgi:hypothetical protein
MPSADLLARKLQLGCEDWVKISGTPGDRRQITEKLVPHGPSIRQVNPASRVLQLNSRAGEAQRWNRSAFEQYSAPSCQHVTTAVLQLNRSWSQA